MTRDKFLQKIESHRCRASDLLEGDGGFQITRGMSHVISGYVEDLFALFLAKSLDDGSLRFFVDKVTSMRLHKESRAKSFKPDLSVVKDNELTHYFDLKTNLGWNRTFVEYLEKKSEFIKLIRGQAVWMNFGELDHFKVSGNIRYKMVVVYGGNINRELLKSNLEKASRIPFVDVYILWKQSSKNGEYEINHKDFDEILASFKHV